MAEDRARKNVEDLFQLVSAQARTVAKLPAAAQDGALTAIRSQHERSGVKAGMSREAAVEMADRLDAWIRAALILTTRQGPQTLH